MEQSKSVVGHACNIENGQRIYIRVICIIHGEEVVLQKIIYEPFSPFFTTSILPLLAKSTQLYLGSLVQTVAFCIQPDLAESAVTVGIIPGPPQMSFLVIGGFSVFLPRFDIVQLDYILKCKGFSGPCCGSPYNYIWYDFNVSDVYTKDGVVSWCFDRACLHLLKKYRYRSRTFPKTILNSIRITLYLLQ